MYGQQSWEPQLTVWELLITSHDSAIFLLHKSCTWQAHSFCNLIEVQRWELFAQNQTWKPFRYQATDFQMTTSKYAGAISNKNLLDLSQNRPTLHGKWFSLLPWAVAKDLFHGGARVHDGKDTKSGAQR